MGLLDDQIASIKDQYFRVWDIVELLVNKKNTEWYEAGQFLGHIDADTELTLFKVDEFYKIHEFTDLSIIRSLIENLMDILPFEGDEEIKEKIRSLKFSVFNFYWLKDELYKYHPIVNLNILPLRPFDFKKAIKPEPTNNTDPKLLVKAISIKDNEINRLLDVNKEQEEQIKKLTSEHETFAENVPYFLYLKPLLTLDEAACIISGDNPRHEAIARREMNDRDYDANFESFIEARDFISSVVDAKQLVCIDYKIERNDFIAFLLKYGITRQGFNEAEADKLGTPTIGHADISHYQRERDQYKQQCEQLQEENENLNARIAELEKQELPKSIFDEILNEDNPKFAPDLAHSVRLWSDLYVQSSKEDSHSNRANIWIEANTGYDKTGTSGNRLREIATPYTEWSIHRDKKYKK